MDDPVVYRLKHQEPCPMTGFIFQPDNNSAFCPNPRLMIARGEHKKGNDYQQNIFHMSKYLKTQTARNYPKEDRLLSWLRFCLYLHQQIIAADISLNISSRQGRKVFAADLSYDPEIFLSFDIYPKKRIFSMIRESAWN